MGKREKLQEKEDDDEEKASKKSAILILSSDDEEGNEDLSSKIVKKALSRASNHKPLLNGSNNNGGVVSVIDLVLSPSQEVEAVADRSGSNGSGAASAPATADAISEKKSKKERKKKKKDKKIEFEDEPVDAVKEEEKTETVKAMEIVTSTAIEIVASTELSPVETPDNIVLRKLLRGPRYFDPPDSSWGTCYNCGEEGHSAFNCKGPKRKKPCFVCGSLDHNFKKCSKGQDCYICKKGGHRAKDCPEKYKGVSQSSKMCLICGHSGHDMFSCRNDYSPDDLKEIQCYVCNSLGHLCCVSSIDAGRREGSCYKCGQLGHTGLACARSHGESTELGTPSSCFRCGEGGHFARECTSSVKAARSHGENTEFGTPSSCFRCGEGGHFARECTTSAKVGKRSREYSTPSRTVKGDKTYLGFKSEPHKKKKMHYEERGITPPRRLKQRGGWITDDPGDFPYRNSKESGWMSPATPAYKSHNISTFTADGQIFGSRSYKKTWNNYSGASTSQGSAKAYKHRFSASRFGNASSGGGTRNYDRW